MRVTSHKVVLGALLAGLVFLTGRAEAQTRRLDLTQTRSVEVPEIRVVGTRVTEEDTVVSPKTINVTAFRIIGLGATPPFEPKSIQVQEIRVTGTRGTR